MTLATIGWAVIWISVCVARWVPGWAPDPTISFNAASFFALVGLGLGIFTLRAKLAWILITGAPLFANGSLLSLRYVIPDLLEPPQLAEESAREGAPAASAFRPR